MTVDRARVQIPAHVKAVAVLLKLATACWDRYAGANRGAEPDPEGEALTHWWVMRRIAQEWASGQSTVLNPERAEALRAALTFMHRQAHRHEWKTSWPVEFCECLTAATLRDLALLQVADQTGVSIPEVAA